MPRLSKHQKDALERIGWTTLQVGLPTLAAYVDLMPAAWIPVGTVALAVLKNLVAAHYSK